MNALEVSQINICSVPTEPPASHNPKTYLFQLEREGQKQRCTASTAFRISKHPSQFFYDSYLQYIQDEMLEDDRLIQHKNKNITPGALMKSTDSRPVICGLCVFLIQDL